MNSTMRKVMKTLKETTIKHWPEISAVIGSIGLVATTVTAIKEYENAKDDICEAKENPSVRTVAKVACDFKKTAIVGGATIGILTGGAAMVNGELMAIGASLKSKTDELNWLRQSGEEVLGEEGWKNVKFRQKTPKYKDGCRVIERENMDPNAVVFDSSSKYYTGDKEKDLAFIQKIERYAQDKLTADGYLFTNFINEGLGIDPYASGQTDGYLKHKNGTVRLSVEPIWYEVSPGTFEYAYAIEYVDASYILPYFN